jgi:hypothetical protein
MTEFRLTHALERRPVLVCDPLTHRPLAFSQYDLAAAVAALLAGVGFIAVAVVEVDPDDEVQYVEREDEATVIVRLLAAEQRAHERRVAITAANN